MKVKMAIKGVFITVLSLILIALSVIAFTKVDKTDDLYEMTKQRDYQIIDKNDECTQKYEDCFYKKDGVNYCYECKKSKEVLLQWQDGSQTKLIDSLNDGKVTIESLIEHGLKVVTNND